MDTERKPVVVTVHSYRSDAPGGDYYVSLLGFTIERHVMFDWAVKAACDVVNAIVASGGSAEMFIECDVPEAMEPETWVAIQSGSSLR